MENRISYPFPLSDGSLIRLYMPFNMPVKDARRLKRMINALYINGKKEAPSSQKVSSGTADDIIYELAREGKL